LFRSKQIEYVPGRLLRRDADVLVHFYGLYSASTSKLHFTVYSDPWTETSSTIVESLTNLIRQAVAAGRRDITCVFDNKSTQHSTLVISYLYYVVVVKSALGPGGRVLVIFMHKVRCDQSNSYQFAYKRINCFVFRVTTF
jgi:hypothetical protein